METHVVMQTEEGVDLEQAINAHGKAIFRYCHLLLRDYHEAQDAVQTTFLRAFHSKTSREKVFGEDDLVPWLYKIAYNCCVDILRKRKRYFRFLDKEKSFAEQNWQIWQNGQTHHMKFTGEDGMTEEVRAALGKLSPQDRALVISRLMDDMDYEQLSQIYNTSAAALRKRYERAKKKLAQALREQGLEGTYGK